MSPTRRLPRNSSPPDPPVISQTTAKMTAAGQPEIQGDCMFIRIDSSYRGGGGAAEAATV